jgi:hypothetical protein
MRSTTRRMAVEAVRTRTKTGISPLLIAALGLVVLIGAAAVALTMPSPLTSNAPPPPPLFISPSPGVVLKFNDTTTNQFEVVEMPAPMRQSFELAWAQMNPSRANLSLSESPAPAVAVAPAPAKVVAPFTDHFPVTTRSELHIEGNVVHLPQQRVGFAVDPETFGLPKTTTMWYTPPQASSKTPTWGGYMPKNFHFGRTTFTCGCQDGGPYTYVKW